MLRAVRSVWPERAEMAAEIVMPRLSDTMEEGTILRWLKRDGEQVNRGEALVEIESDKASMPYESDRDGRLEIVAQEGRTLPVGELIARLRDDNAERADGGEGGAEAKSAAERSTPAKPEPAREPGAGSRGEAAITGAAEGTSLADAPPAASPARIKASPLARRVAREMGVQLAGISGTGPGGRIVRADIELRAHSGGPGAAEISPGATSTPAQTPIAEPAAPAASTGDLPPAGRPAAEAIAQTPGAATATAKGQSDVQELSRTQQLIARRMAESKATIPHFTLSADVDMEAAVALREQLRGHRIRQQLPTYNDMIVKATALALREHPRLNAGYRDGQAQLHGRINVAIAVATAADGTPASSLLVPTIFEADSKSLGEIAREAHGAAARVREGTITPPELSGATFTISNLGMYGVRSFSAIINPPQAAILAVGEVAQRAVVHDRRIAARHVVTLNLSCDHRLLYGADAAQFLARIRELLEEPALLTL